MNHIDKGGPMLNESMSNVFINRNKQVIARPLKYQTDKENNVQSILYIFLIILTLPYYHLQSES